MSKPVVTGFPQSTYVWTARAALNLKGVEHDFVPLAPPANRAPEHLARHPWGKVPAFEHEGVQLIETTAICSYVDTAFEGPALQPSEPVALARMHQWISVANSYLYPAAVLRFALQYIFPRGAGGAPDMDTIQGAVPDIKKAIQFLDQGLGEADWFGGDGPNLADLFVGPLLFTTQMFPGGPALHEGFDNIQRLKGNIARHAGIMSAAPQR